MKTKAPTPWPAWLMVPLAQVLRLAMAAAEADFWIKSALGFGVLFVFSWLPPAGWPCLVWVMVAMGGVVVSCGFWIFLAELNAAGWSPVTQRDVLDGLIKTETQPTLQAFWAHQQVMLWRDLQALEVVGVGLIPAAHTMTLRSVVARFAFAEQWRVSGVGPAPR